MFIRDGQSKHGSAYVDANGRLQTKSVSSSRLSDQAEVGKAFAVYGKAALTGTSATPLILLKNDSQDKQIHVAQFVLSADGASVKYEFHFDSTRTSGGTLITPVNMHRGKGNTTQAEVYHNPSTNLVLSTNEDYEFMDVILTASGLPSMAINTSEGIILGPSRSLSVMVEGANGDNCRCAMHYFEET